MKYLTQSLIWDRREPEFLDMERHKDIERERERQQERECNAEQAVTKHFEESLRRAKEKQMRGWSLNAIPPQHIPHLGIPPGHVLPPSTQQQSVIGVGGGGNGGTSGTGGALVHQQPQHKPSLQQQQQTAVHNLHDERRRVSAAEHERIMAAERDRDREREKDRELERIRQQEDNRRSYYVAQAVASATLQQQQQQQRHQQKVSVIPDYAAAGTAQQQQQQQHRSLLLGSSGGSNSGGQPQSSSLSLSSQKITEKSASQQIKTTPNTDPGVYSMYGYGYQQAYHKDLKTKELLLPTPPPLMSDVKHSAGVIVKHDTHKPLIQQQQQQQHQHMHTASKLQQQQQQSLGHYKSSAVQQQSPSAQTTPQQQQQSSVMYEYRSNQPPQTNSSSHDRYKQVSLPSGQSIYIQQQSSSTTQSQHQHHQQQQQHHSSQQQQQQSVHHQQSQSQSHHLHPHHQPAQQIQSVGGGSGNAGASSHYISNVIGGSTTPQSKPKVSSPAPSHIYGKPIGAGIVSGIPVCRSSQDPSQPIHVINSKSASPSAFSHSPHAPYSSNVNQQITVPPPPAHSSRYDTRIYSSPSSASISAGVSSSPIALATGGGGNGGVGGSGGAGISVNNKQTLPLPLPLQPSSHHHRILGVSPPLNTTPGGISSIPPHRTQLGMPPILHSVGAAGAVSGSQLHHLQQQQQQQPPQITSAPSISGVNASNSASIQTQPLDLGVTSTFDRNREQSSSSPKRKLTPVHHPTGSPIPLDIKKKRIESPPQPHQPLHLTTHHHHSHNLQQQQPSPLSTPQASSQIHQSHHPAIQQPPPSSHHHHYHQPTSAQQLQLQHLQQQQALEHHQLHVQQHNQRSQRTPPPPQQQQQHQQIPLQLHQPFQSKSPQPHHLQQQQQQQQQQPLPLSIYITSNPSTSISSIPSRGSNLSDSVGDGSTTILHPLHQHHQQQQQQHHQQQQQQQHPQQQQQHQQHLQHYPHSSSPLDARRSTTSPMIGGTTTVPFSDPPTVRTPKPASEATSGSDIPPLPTAKSPINNLLLNTNNGGNSMNNSNTNNNNNNTITTTMNTTTMLRTNSADGLVRPSSSSVNSSPAPSPGGSSAQSSAPPTPAKFPPEPEKSSSPALSTSSSAPRHLKKAWLQRHTGEDTEDTTGITGSGNCVKLPLTLTPPPQSSSSTSATVTVTLSSSITPATNDQKSLKSTVGGNENHPVVASATNNSTTLSSSSSSSTSIHSSFNNIGMMAVNSINKSKPMTGGNKNKKIISATPNTTDNGHNTDSENKEDSSSSDQDRVKPAPKRKLTKAKRRGVAARNKVQEEKKKKVTSDSDKDSDSDKESMSEKDSDGTIAALATASATPTKKSQSTNGNGSLSSSTSTTTGATVASSGNGGGKSSIGGSGATSMSTTGSGSGGGGGGGKDKDQQRKRGRRPKDSSDMPLKKKKTGDGQQQQEQQQQPIKDPFRKPPIAQLKKTGESFLQNGPCFEVAPKLAKCRECRWTPNQRSKNTPNIFCRFYAFRRLRYTKNGMLAIAGFSDPHKDPLEDDLKLWMPDDDDPPRDLDMHQSRFLLAQVADQFCDLLTQEKEAMTQHMSDDKVIAWKRVVQGVREMCDVCETTLFNYHWACGKCGFVVCLDCYKCRKNGLIKIWGEINRDRDDFSWLLCTNRSAHEQERLMLTQIIAGDSLQILGRHTHETRALWGIPQYCGCPLSKEQPPKATNGLCKDLIKSMIKSEQNGGSCSGNTTGDESTMSGVATTTKIKKEQENIVNGVKVKNEKDDSKSALSWLADVALQQNESKTKKNNGGGDDGKTNIKMEIKNDNSDDSDSSSDDEGGHSTLRELLIRPTTTTASSTTTNTAATSITTTTTTTATTGARPNGGGSRSTSPAVPLIKPPKKNKLACMMNLDDVIATVVTSEKKVKKENDEENEVDDDIDDRIASVPLLHYLSGNKKNRRYLPIRIMTMSESKALYPNVPHVWLCDGKLLRLLDPAHPQNFKLFQEQWKRGQPVIVSEVSNSLNMNLWRPESFSRDFGEDKNDLINCMTGNLVPNQPMKRFWDGFDYVNKRLKDEKGNSMLLKLKDWPPGEDFAEILPTRFIDLMNNLPLGDYTKRNGKFNLASRLPDCFVKPDLGPKMYNAYGSALHPTKGTTNLHLDISDAVNVMVYVGIPQDTGTNDAHIKEAFRAIDDAGCDILTRRRVRDKNELPGALWHIYAPRDADKIRDLLNKVAIERGARLEPNHDPIHDQSWYLDGVLRERLYKEYAVEGYPIAQCLGDAVFIPAGAPHQVRNLHNCIKVAEDFVSPENVAHCFQLTQEFRELSDTHSNHEDKLQIKNIIYHAVKDAVACLSHLLGNRVAESQGLVQKMDDDEEDDDEEDEGDDDDEDDASAAAADKNDDNGDNEEKNEDGNDQGGGGRNRGRGGRRAGVESDNEDGGVDGDDKKKKNLNIDTGKKSHTENTNSDGSADKTNEKSIIKSETSEKTKSTTSINSTSSTKQQQ